MTPKRPNSKVLDEPPPAQPELPLQIDPDDALIQEPRNNVFHTPEEEFDESETANVSE
jgi:hypothetical protein